ncbi:DUF3105 domain-containing protein [Nocardioides ferulae]|uniref:DUF3105 domain-containing protein n=1 Tax=Nocardioides ferulae TaxID=2340821 RepID=UPI000EAC0ACC|nr:DUF3105 domain-containing protein [Nocardioides ferulae]
MAKNPPKTDRQAVIDDLRKKQKSAERRRGFMIVGVCSAIALLIVGAALIQPIKNYLDEKEFEGLAVEDIGAPASACQPIETKPADGEQDHVPPGTPILYEDAPPAFGQHYDMPDTMERKFYRGTDRPPLGTLVHNLEHGYTVMWYDETAAEDEAVMEQIEAIADNFEGTSNMRLKFKAVPWTEADGGAFPEGQHIALTHWSVGGAENAGQGEHVGVWQYCSEPSGAALKEFMDTYDYMDSPEPNAM